jgi:hypothetical protein
MMCGEAVPDAKAGLPAVARAGAVGGGSAGGSRGTVPPGQHSKESGCE